jgi:hypothetical protein
VGNFSNFQKQRLGLWLITFAAIEYFFALFENSTLLTFFLIFFPAILVILLPKIKFIAEAKEIHIYESMFWLFITVPYFHYFFGVLNSFIVFFLTVGFSITSAPFGRGKIKLFGIGTSIVIGLSIYIFTSFTYLSCLFLSLGIIKFLSYDIVKPKNKSSVELSYWNVSLREGWEFIYPFTRKRGPYIKETIGYSWLLFVVEKNNPNIIYRLDVEERKDAWDINSQHYQESSFVKMPGLWYDLERKFSREEDNYIKIHGDISHDTYDAIYEKVTRNLIWKNKIWKNKSRNTATENEQLQVFRGIILEFITDDVESKYKKHKDYEEYLKWDISPLKTDALQTYHLRRIGYHLATKFNDEMTAENAFGYAFKIVDIQIDVGITNLQDAQEELTDILNDYMFCNEGEAKILADHYKIKL